MSCISPKSIEDCFQLQELQDMFTEWCKPDKLIKRIVKCVVITFHRSKSPITFDCRIDGIVFSRVDLVNDLGVVLGAKFTFNQHHYNDFKSFTSIGIHRENFQCTLLQNTTVHWYDRYSKMLQ